VGVPPFGRLVQTRTPFGSASVRQETYLYDGIRRVQDYVVDDPTGHELGDLDREYVWSVDGRVDELICEIDADGHAFWAIHDIAGDLVALCDLGGTNDTARVVAQWRYDPYGEVLAAEQIHTSPEQRVGHKGLFVDYLDEDFAIYHNRNRTYMPEYGRFAQRDPHAMGGPIAFSLASGGQSVSFATPDIDLRSHLRDGHNTYQYLMSSPSLHFDPLGLFVGFLIPGPGDFITGMLESLVYEYANRLDFDVEWAGDWNAADDWHSRLENDWILIALGQGVYDSFSIGFGQWSVNPLDAMAAAALPPAIIVKQNGVIVEHYYRRNDHAPAHVHVSSDGQRPTRVNRFGDPIDGTDRPLTAKERKVFKNNRFEIHRAIAQIEGWLAQQQVTDDSEREKKAKRGRPGRRR
jgi:RHS repeat-associated protein